MSWFGSGILTGLRITMRNMLRGPITVQYPHERLEIPERARWAVEMKPDEDGNHKCTGCLACEKACPDFIIKIDVTTAEDRSKHIDHWHYELGACMMCGLCVEACPFDAIRMGHDYELARTDVSELQYDLLTDVAAVQPKRKAAVERPGAERQAPTDASQAPTDAGRAATDAPEAETRSPEGSEQS